MKIYQNYHKHTSLSHRYNKDSSLVPMDYFKAMKPLADEGISQIYSTVEHGWQGNYFKIYDDLEKFNKNNLEKNPNYKPIKFIFGTEGYWVKDRFEKDSSNNHIVLLAKNNNGRKKINRAIYESFKTGYYYKNRMDLNILLNLPKSDVFVTSSCLAFWTGYGDLSKNDFSDNDKIVLELFNHFDDFYLEVQSNNTELQKSINRHIIELHNKYDIPIIAGTDSHEIKMEQIEEREDLLRSNGIHYDNEDGNYMDFPSYDVLYKRFQEQGILSESEILESINNTNKILEFEDIILDRSLKVPIAKEYRNKTQEERNEIFENILKDEWDKQYDDVNIDKFDEYKKEIQHDIKEIEDCNMTDYFIDSYEIMKLGQEKYGGILTPSGRGSAVSMYLNKLLRLTKVDKVNSPVLMYSERFLTASRVLDSHTPPDIDSNCSDRQPFIQAQRDIIGENGTFDLIALGTLHYKSAFKMYSRAYNLEPQLANEVTKQIDKYELAIKHAEDDEKDLIDIYSYVDKEKYGDLIEGCHQYMGIVDTLKAHPCGSLALDGDAIEEIGVIMVKSESQGEKAKETFVAVIESGTIDAFGYLKQDYLIVDSIGLTYDIYKEIGMEPLSVNQLLEVIEDNQKVWDIYSNGYTMCINQCEQQKSTEKVMRFKPKNISELTQFIAGIRPSFQSMYKIFESREHFDYGIKAFDDLIQDKYCNSSFILYQEHLMKVLGFAGFPMSETYTIIKAISKKKDYIIKGAKDKFIPNFADAIINTKETTDRDKAIKMSEKVWKVIEDSAAYGFNSAHAYCMAIDSVTLAYLKAYYPLEFYKVTLQRYTDKGNKDKVASLKNEMVKIGIKINNIKFRNDNRKFSINHNDNSINQTMSSIKNMQKIVPDVLYNLGEKYKNTDNSVEVLMNIFHDLLNTKLNKTSIDILIKLDYFSDFGDINYIIYQMNIYKDIADIINKFAECKQLNKDYIESLGFNLQEIIKCCNTETKKQLKDIDNEKLMNYISINYTKIIDLVSNNYIYNPISNIKKISYELKFNGCTDIIDSNIDSDIYIIASIETNKYGTPFLTLYHVRDGIIKTIKVDKKQYKENPCVEGDILRCAFRTQLKKIKETDNNGKEEWVETGDSEIVLKVYSIEESD